MIQFKEINNQLCIMLEKAVPLTEDAKFPCAVKMINDDSPMGRYNTHGLIPSCFEPIIAKEEPFSGWDISRYEILGYPVADHSVEWALYRMMQGDKVFQKDNHFKRYYKNGNVCWLDMAGIERSLTTELFLKNFANTIDWQIYAEKPLLAESRKGDLCQRRDGKWVQVDPDSSSRKRIRTSDNYFHSLDGSTPGLASQNICDIISTEPLAAKGSAEWAWQMAKLGIETKCSRGKIRISKSGMIEVCYNGMAYAMPMTQSPENRQYVINKMCECSPDGWQLYEPKQEPCPACNGTGKVEKPAPAFKVGDWVECDGEQFQLIEKSDDAYDARKAWVVRDIDGNEPEEIYEDGFSRKLSPSEVRVKITLKGTVEKRKDNRFAFNLVSGITNSAIHYDMLDHATAAMVRELIEKQQGDAK